MAINRNRPRFKDLNVGDKVRSRPIATKPAFSGIIVEKVMGRSYFNVRDESDGTIWHRKADELQLAAPISRVLP